MTTNSRIFQKKYFVLKSNDTFSQFSFLFVDMQNVISHKCTLCLIEWISKYEIGNFTLLIRMQKRVTSTRIKMSNSAIKATFHELILIEGGMLRQGTE